MLSQLTKINFIEVFLKLAVCFAAWQRNSIYARVDSVLRKIRETSEVIHDHITYINLLPVYLITDPVQFYADCPSFCSRVSENSPWRAGERKEREITH